MRKLLSTFILFTFFILFGNAQSKEPSVEMPQTRPTTFEDYLVQQAWTFSPEAEMSKYEIETRSQEIQLAKKDWTRNLNAAINLNDVSFPYFVRYNLGVERIGGRAIDTSRFSRIATYPLWQIGVGINFGDLIQRKHKVKFAENRKKMSESDLNLKRYKIKADLLKRYEGYLVAQEILKVRLQSLDVAQSNKSQISSLFSVNKATFEDYNEANKSYFDAMEARLKAQSDIKITQIALEELIGVKWESIEKVRLNYEQKK